MATDAGERHPPADDDALDASSFDPSSFDALPVAVLVVDGPSGHIRRANQACCALLGYSPAELDGWPSELIVLPDEGAALPPDHVRCRCKDGTELVARVDTSRRGTTLVSVLADATRDLAATQETDSARRSRQLLLRAAHACAAPHSGSRLATDVCRAVVEEAGAVMAWVGLVDAGGRIAPFASWGFEGSYLDGMAIPLAAGPEAGGPAARALRRRSPSVCADVATDPSMAPWRDAALRLGFLSCAAVCLEAGSDALGTLVAYGDRTDAFGPSLVESLDAAGRLLARRLADRPY